MKQVYLDNAASTALSGEVIEAMYNTMATFYGNPSSTHNFGRKTKALLEKARKNIAKCLNADASEIIFTSGGTESDNFALRCAVRDLKLKTLITSPIEHHAVLHTVKQLQKEYDIKLHYVNLTENGTIDYGHLQVLLNENQEKTLVSLMHINNETGVLTDIKKIAALCTLYGAFFHSDTVQTIGHYPLDLKSVKIDSVVGSAHKFHGPKGVGFVYIRKNSGLKPFVCGGSQERGMRGGTENLTGIVGMEKALLQACENMETDTAYILELKRYFMDHLQTSFPEVQFNGIPHDEEKSAYTLVNVRFPKTKTTKLLLFHMDMKGIAVSQGSACQSGADSGSHVLKAFLTEEEMEQTTSIRFSFSKNNTQADIDYTIAVLKEILLAEKTIS